MMGNKYRFPDIDSDLIYHKGRRFWIVEVPESGITLVSPGTNPWGEISKKDADYVLYDAKSTALYSEGYYASLKILDDGRYRVDLFISITNTYDFADSIEDMIRVGTWLIDDYFKTTSGALTKDERLYYSP